MRRAQFAMEFLLVVGFSTLILMMILFLVNSQFLENKKDADIKQIDEITRELSFNAEKIYYQGKPSRTTMELYFPEGITNILIKDNFIVFDTNVNIPVSHYVPINVTGNLRTGSGIHKVLIESNETYVIISEVG